MGYGSGDPLAGVGMRCDLTPEQRRDAARVAAIANADTLAWAKATLARFPARSDLRDLISSLERE